MLLSSKLIIREFATSQIRENLNTLGQHETNIGSTFAFAGRLRLLGVCVCWAFAFAGRLRLLGVCVCWAFAFAGRLRLLDRLTM